MSKLISPRRPAVRHTSYRLTKHADQRHAQNTLRKHFADPEPVSPEAGAARERLADYDREGNAATLILCLVIVACVAAAIFVGWHLSDWPKVGK